MAPQDFYRKKNKDLLTIIHEMSEKFATHSDVSVHAEDFSFFMEKLSEELHKHLPEEEDKQFFLHLLNSSDRYTAKLTENYIREMGKLASVIETYLESYSNPTKIKQDPSNFMVTTKHVEQFLNQKVNYDNTGFYGLLGKMH